MNDFSLIVECKKTTKIFTIVVSFIFMIFAAIFTYVYSIEETYPIVLIVFLMIFGFINSITRKIVISQYMVEYYRLFRPTKKCCLNDIVYYYYSCTDNVSLYYLVIKTKFFKISIPDNYNNVDNLIRFLNSIGVRERQPKFLV